jgi:hypothetical protein
MYLKQNIDDHEKDQQDHKLFNRHQAIALLCKFAQPLALTHMIPAVISQPVIDPQGPDSDSELNFALICAKRGFPVPPKAQFRVSFDGGSYTDADWAYPEQKVLVFIDGMGPALHGDPARRQRDRLLRAKARMKGFKVVEMTAEALKDDGCLSVHLNELAIYLDFGPDSLKPQ